MVFKNNLNKAKHNDAWQPEVEALRGVAALVVVVYHFLAMKPLTVNYLVNASIDDYLNLFLRCVFNGAGAVMLFFVMSGYVLSLGLGKNESLSAIVYLKFLVRRFFRIFPALWFSILVAILILVFYHNQHPTIKDILSALMLGEKAQVFNGPLWSTEVEIYANIFYPLLVFASVRYGLLAQFIVAVILSMWTWYGSYPYYWVQYAFCFQLGIMVATLGNYIMKHISGAAEKIFAALGCLALMVSTPLSQLGYIREAAHVLLESWGAFILLSYIVYGKSNFLLIKYLSSKKLMFLGAISYSLYLLHFPVNSLLNNIAFGILGSSSFSNDYSFLYTMGMCFFALPIDLLVAFFAYKLVEKPFQSIGRKIEL